MRRYRNQSYSQLPSSFVLLTIKAYADKYEVSPGESIIITVETSREDVIIEVTSDSDNVSIQQLDLHHYKAIINETDKDTVTFLIKVNQPVTAQLRESRLTILINNLSEEGIFSVASLGNPVVVYEDE